MIRQLIKFLTEYKDRPMYEHWKNNYCSKGIHFVETKSAPYCVACGKLPNAKRT